MWQVALRIAKPRHQPLSVHLAANFGEFRANFAANQLRFSGTGDRQVDSFSSAGAA